MAIVTLLTRRGRAHHVLHVQQAAGASALLLAPASLAVAARARGGALPPLPSLRSLPELARIGFCSFAGLCCWIMRACCMLRVGSAVVLERGSGMRSVHLLAPHIHLVCCNVRAAQA